MFSARASGLVVACAVVVGAAFAAPIAVSGQPVYERFTLRYDSRKTDSRTGFLLQLEQRETPAGEQPPVVRRGVFRLAAGTHADTGAVGRCAASDDELQSRGLAACPAGSRIGSGEADVFLGQGGDATLAVTAFNTRAGLVAALSLDDHVIRTIRARVRGSRVSVTFPRVELAGGFEAALTRFELRIRPAGTPQRPWARTPENCPKDGRWRTRYIATYDEPLGRQVMRDASRCRRSGPPDGSR
jgi:hypothetical protein